MFKMLFSNFNMYAYLSMSAAIAALITYNIFLKQDIETLNLQIDSYENKMENLKIKSEIFEDKINIASINAVRSMEDHTKKANSILSEVVSSDCEKAVIWAKEQAARI